MTSAKGCGNDDPTQLVQKTRIVGYFSDPRVWNKSKKGELKDRQATKKYYTGEVDSIRDLEAEILESIIEKGKIRIGIIGSSGCSLCEGLEKMVNHYLSNIPEDIRSNVEFVKYDVKTEDGKINAVIYNSPIDVYPTLVVHKGKNFLRKSSEYPYGKSPQLIKPSEIDAMFKEISALK